MNDKTKKCDRVRLAEYPELHGHLYGDDVQYNEAKQMAESLKKSRTLATLALSLNAATVTGLVVAGGHSRSTSVAGLVVAGGHSRSAMQPIDYPPLILDPAHLASIKQDLDHVMHVVKGRTARGNGLDVTYKIDSLSELEDVVFDLKRSGDPCWPLPEKEQEHVGVTGFKLKPNATSMYQMFVERNNKRR